MFLFLNFDQIKAKQVCLCTIIEKSFLLHFFWMFVIQMIFEFFHGVVLSTGHAKPTQEIQMRRGELGPRMDNVEM